MNLLAFFEARALSNANRQLSREQFEKKRLARFRRFARYIQRKSPWYAQIMSEQKIDPADCVPAQFPVLTKSAVMEHFDDIVTERTIRRVEVEAFVRTSRNPGGLFRDKYTVIKTSGSSGEPGYYIYSPAAWSRAMAQLAASREFAYWGRKRVAFFGSAKTHQAGVTTCLALNRWPLRLIYQTRALDINLPMAEVVAALNQFQPHVMMGYATALKTLAEEQMDGRLRMSPESVSAGGEPLRDADRQAIEATYGKCLRDAYASSEFGLMGLREPSWRSMRLMEDYLIFELHSDHILVTGIGNELMPLVRYRMSDVLHPVASDEHSPYTTVSEVVGRMEQSARFLNRRGVNDTISRATLSAMILPGVRRLQMRVRSTESFDFAIEMYQPADAAAESAAIEAARRELDAILREKHMENVLFTVFRVPVLPLDASGKYRTIVNENAAG
jgi:phenylacetate-coenzyme A ligase PaaK-like adenylate-forming protein